MADAISILLVDDDTELCATLGRLLSFDGFRVTSVHDGESGVREALSGSYRLAILDVMLPGGDGRKVLRQVRVKSDLPVIMLTARGDDTDRIAGLEAGADDYLPKPFNARELVARIRAILRRNEDKPKQGSFAVGDLEVHLNSRRVMQSGNEVSLTSAEYEILLLLLRSVGKPLSREDIAETALGRPVGPLDRSIDNHISNLRKKLGPQLNGVDRIRNIRGTGYCYTGEVG
jgi:two-component system, OmpR family, response regulator CpxR